MVWWLCLQKLPSNICKSFLVNHEVLPCVFALLPSKAEIVHKQFFTAVRHAVRNNNGNDPDGFLVDFETAAINGIRNILPQTDISGCFFHLSSRTCGSISNLLDYKNVTWKNPNLVYSYVLLLLYPSCFHRMRLTPWMNFVLILEIIMMEMLIKCSTISRIITLVVFVGMPPDSLLYFLRCSIEPPKSFHKQIIILRLGIIVSKQMFHPLIQRSGSF